MSVITYVYCDLAPVASDSYSYNAAMSGGTSVTVTGLSFGSMEYTLSTMLADRICATVLWSSATSVTAISSTILGLLVNDVRLTVGAVAGTAAALFTFDGTLSRNNFVLTIRVLP